MGLDCGEVPEELLEAEVIEEADEAVPAATVRALPVARSGSEVSPFGDGAKTVAIAAAGGIVAGAATVAVVKAATRAPAKRSRRLLGRRDKRQDVVASRSFLVDVHLLGGR